MLKSIQFGLYFCMVLQGVGGPSFLRDGGCPSFFTRGKHFILPADMTYFTNTFFLKLRNKTCVSNQIRKQTPVCEMSKWSNDQRGQVKYNPCHQQGVV